jgi:hypothetical protein
MTNGSAAAPVSSMPAFPTMADLSALSLTDLRRSRRDARSQLEVAQLRARQAQGVDAGPVDRLKALVDRLTDELIARYERDPGLIDLILSEVPDGREGRS